jgi:translation elongation factor EF-Ts
MSQTGYNIGMRRALIWLKTRQGLPSFLHERRKIGVTIGLSVKHYTFL